MSYGVAGVWVPVEDMERALAFYRDTLQLEVLEEGTEWSEVTAGGLRIGLNGLERAGSADAGAVISFQPEGTIDDEYARLKDQGVELTGEITDHQWGRIAPFKDTEGNDLQLFVFA